MEFFSAQASRYNVVIQKVKEWYMSRNDEGTNEDASDDAVFTSARWSISRHAHMRVCKSGNGSCSGSGAMVVEGCQVVTFWQN